MYYAVVLLWLYSIATHVYGKNMFSVTSVCLYRSSWGCLGLERSYFACRQISIIAESGKKINGSSPFNLNRLPLPLVYLYSTC